MLTENWMGFATDDCFYYAWVWARPDGIFAMLEVR